MGRYETDILKTMRVLFTYKYVVEKRIFNTEVAKIQFNKRTSDLEEFFGVGEVGGRDGVHRH
jgi:hypothetical protein